MVAGAVLIVGLVYAMSGGSDDETDNADKKINDSDQAEKLEKAQAKANKQAE